MLPSSLGKCWSGLLQVPKPFSFDCSQGELQVLLTYSNATFPEVHGEEKHRLMWLVKNTVQ